MSATEPWASPVSVNTFVPSSDCFRSRIAFMPGLCPADITLPAVRTTTASRPKLAISSVGTTFELSNNPPSSASRPTTAALSAPRITSRTSPIAAPSSKARIGFPITLLPLRISSSSGRRREVEQVDGDRDDDHHGQQQDEVHPSSVGFALQAHVVSSVGPVVLARVVP